MNVRSLLLLVALGVVAIGVLATPAEAQVKRPFNIASDSYFTLDVPNGTAKARVQAEIELAGGTDLKEFWLWAMPSAKNVEVKQGDDLLKTAIKPVGDVVGLPNLVVVTLPKPLKPNLRTKIVMTYDVPVQTTALVKMEAGAIEAIFVSQGPGSFVFIDAPKEADNFIEPGCLRASKQPSEVSDAGMERYVCGQTLLAAVYAEDAEVQARCANLDDRCRQRYDSSPFIGFVQSITDSSKQGHFSEDVQLAGGTKKLTLTFFRRDQAWATQQFAIATQALPKLEAVYGFNYPHDTILLRESNLLLDFALGIAFTGKGEVLITRTDSPGRLDESVTVHELAHQWAGHQLESSWLWEGLAEYGRISVRQSLGLPPNSRETGWKQFPYKDRLGNWYNGSGVYNPDYWYGKAGAFWVAYAAAIGGPETMTRVLAQIDDNPKRWPLDGRWFIDRGEEVSGANLDALFLEWVWQDSAADLLKERRAAHDLTSALYAHGLQFGFTGFPVDLQAQLDGWTFKGVADSVNQATGVLDRYAKLVVRANAANLDVAQGVAGSWSTKTLPELGVLVGSMEAAITSIIEGQKQVALQPDDPLAQQRLAAAKLAFTNGNYTEAQRLASGAATSTLNKEAAEKLIAFAIERQKTFSPGFFQKIGLYFADPDGKVASAQTAFAASDYETALRDSRSAIQTWDGAQRAGLFRLALLLGFMAAVFVGGWWAVKRVGDRARPAPVRRESHMLGERTDRAGSWKEWLEQKDPGATQEKP